MLGRPWTQKRFFHGGNTGSNPVGDATHVNGLWNSSCASVPVVSRQQGRSGGIAIHKIGQEMTAHPWPEGDPCKLAPAVSTCAAKIAEPVVSRVVGFAIRL